MFNCAGKVDEYERQHSTDGRHLLDNNVAHAELGAEIWQREQEQRKVSQRVPSHIYWRKRREDTPALMSE